VRASSRPREWSAGELQGLVSVVETFAHLNLLLAQLRAGILEVVVAQSPVDLGLCQQVLHDPLHFIAVRVWAQWPTIASVSVLASELVGLKQVVEPRGVRLAAGLHRLVQALLVELGLVQPILEVLFAERLDLGSVHGAARLVVVRLEAVFTAMSKGTADHVALLQHLRLVLFQPRVPLHRKVQVLGSARVWVAQVVRHVVVTCKSREVAALHGDDLRLGIVGHLDIEHEGDLASDLGGLAQEHEAVALECAAFYAEALAGVHLPEEADLPVLLRKHPDAEQVAARHEGFIEVVARPPGTLGAGVLGHGGIDSAGVAALVDPEVHAARLLVVGVCHDLARLCCPQHATFYRLLDELFLAARKSDPPSVERVRLGHVARSGAASRPWEWAAGELQGLVSVVETLAQLDLPLGQLRARVREVVVAQGPVPLRFVEEHLAQVRDLLTVRIGAEGTAEAPVRVFASELVRFEQVVEASVVRLAADGVRLVEALLVPLRLVQPAFETILPEMRNLSRVQGPSLASPARLQAGLLAKTRLRNHKGGLRNPRTCLLLSSPPRRSQTGHLELACWAGSEAELGDGILHTLLVLIGSPIVCKVRDAFELELFRHLCSNIGVNLGIGRQEAGEHRP